jgi:sortase A
MLWLLYRLIYHYLLAKESFKLQLRVLDENDMAAIQSLFLYSNNGKKAMKRQGKPIELTPDSLGNYEIDNLPKMLYCLKTGDNALIIIVGQNKLHQKDLVIKQSKHSIKSFEVIGENIIRLH